MLRKLISSYKNILLLALVAVPVGVLVGVLDAAFGNGLLWLTGERMRHPYWFIPFLGLGGAAIVWVNETFGGVSRRGMSLIFEAGHGVASKIPLRLIPLTIGGTWLTHLFGGSAGREGVAIQLGGTLAHGIGRHLPVAGGARALLIAGMAAGFAGLFGTPVSAAFFAVEVLAAGRLEHEALLPALAAAFAADFTASRLGLERFSFALAGPASPPWPLALKLTLLGAAFGAAGGLFSALLHKLKAVLAGWLKNPLLRILVAGAVISAVSLMCWNGRYSGLGTNLIADSFGGDAFIWDAALKLAFTVATISAGFPGGEVTPLFAIGSTLGVALAPVLGLPPAFAAALGYAALFGGATNTLIAPILLGAEVFGYAHLPYFAVACALAYACNGNASIYPLQKRAG